MSQTDCEAKGQAACSRPLGEQSVCGTFKISSGFYMILSGDLYDVPGQTGIGPTRALHKAAAA